MSEDDQRMSDDWIGIRGAPPPKERRRARTPRGPRTRRDRSSLWFALRAVVAVAVIIGAGVAAYTLTREENPGPPPIVTSHYENREAGYSFDYPTAWELREDGTTASVTEPNHHALVSFGLGAKGTLEKASERLVSEIEQNNTDVEIGETQPQQVAGFDALATNGLGSNRQGQRIRFLAVTLRAANRNFAIVIYAAEDADPERIVAPAQAILESFRPPGTP
jgi:hypothetical protein